MADIYERRCIGETAWIYTLKTSFSSMDPGDCEECGGPCIKIQDNFESVTLRMNITEACMFCGMVYMKWKRSPAI